MPGASSRALRRTPRQGGIRAAAVIAALSVAGCAMWRPQTCEQFEVARQHTDYATTYHRDATETVAPLRRGPAVMATFYRLRLDTERAHPCSHLMMQKELVLARRDEPGVMLEETREFFAEDGTRIAVKSENLTNQLRQSGRYTASVPLPIPKRAPAGTYYLVNTLTAKQRGHTEVLAKTAARFEVVARNK